MSLLFKHSDGSESGQLPVELVLLISDSLEAPATFLLVQQLSLALKAKRRCVLVGLANSFEHYAALLRKQGVQLASERQKGNFAYVDAAKQLAAGSGALSRINEQVREAFSDGALVLFDDFAALLYAGEEPLGLLKGFRRLLALARYNGGSLVTVFHDDAFSPGRTGIERQPDEHFLLRNLIQLSDIWIQTRSLRAQMTGELVIHRAPAMVGPSPITSTSINAPLQYKLEEASLAHFFAKGTGKGFL